MTPAVTCPKAWDGLEERPLKWSTFGKEFECAKQNLGLTSKKKGRFLGSKKHHAELFGRFLCRYQGLVASGDGKEVRAVAMIWDTGSKTGEVTGHTKQARQF